MRAASRGVRGVGSLSLQCDEVAGRLVASIISRNSLDLYHDDALKYRMNVFNHEHGLELAKYRQGRCMSLLDLVEEDDNTAALAQLGRRSTDENAGPSRLLSCTPFIIREMHEMGSTCGTRSSYGNFGTSSCFQAENGNNLLGSSMTDRAVHTCGFPCSVTRRYCLSEKAAIVSKFLRHASSGTTENEREAPGTSKDDNGGWTYDEIVNVPNALSAARLVSGPIIGTLILNGEVRSEW